VPAFRIVEALNIIEDVGALSQTLPERLIEQTTP
jgi:hypothetical protein